MRDVSRRGFVGFLAASLGFMSRPVAASTAVAASPVPPVARVVGGGIGWVPVLRASAETPVSMLLEAAQTWAVDRRPLPVTVDFSEASVGLVVDVRVVNDTLEVLLDLPEHTAKRVRNGECEAVAPAYMSHHRDRRGHLMGARLLMVALTSMPTEHVPRALRDHAVRRQYMTEQRLSMTERVQRVLSD